MNFDDRKLIDVRICSTSMTFKYREHILKEKSGGHVECVGPIVNGGFVYRGRAVNVIDEKIALFEIKTNWPKRRNKENSTIIKRALISLYALLPLRYRRRDVTQKIKIFSINY